MIATLPMYDRPETRDATDRFWELIRDNLADAPARLTRDGDLWALWQSPDLLLAQTCGLPFRAALHTRVHLVGTPDYGLPGCPPGYYRSVLIARDDGERRESARCLMQRRIAVNDPLSQSGWAVLAALAQEYGLDWMREPDVRTPGGPRKGRDARRDKGMLGPVRITGGHRASARAVTDGQAEVAAIDAVTWEQIRRHDRFAGGLREVLRTEPTPGLPLITARSDRVPALRAAVRRAIDGLSAEDRETLMLRGLAHIPAEAYLRLPLPAKPPLAA